MWLNPPCVPHFLEGQGEFHKQLQQRMREERREERREMRERETETKRERPCQTQLLMLG